MAERNVLGGELAMCGTDPLTGFFRDGCCNTGPQDLGSHTICAVVTEAFLDHQRNIGNDLSTPMPQYRFPGLVPGDRWCVTAPNWLRAYQDGAASPVVLAATNERVLEIVPIGSLAAHVDDLRPSVCSPGQEPGGGNVGAWMTAVVTSSRRGMAAATNPASQKERATTERTFRPRTPGRWGTWP